jgi:hypothetical protein
MQAWRRQVEGLSIVPGPGAAVEAGCPNRAGGFAAVVRTHEFSNMIHIPQMATGS